MAFDYKTFEYVSPPGLQHSEPRHPVVIVGAGPIGLAAALELANYGVASIVLTTTIWCPWAAVQFVGPKDR